MDAFRIAAGHMFDVHLSDYDALHRWSVSNPLQFWDAVWAWGNIVAEHKGSVVASNLENMLETEWYPEARLNFAENLLVRQDDAPAIIAWAEGRQRQEISFAELYQTVSRVAQSLQALGIEPGDRVVGWLPTIPEAVIAMLATTSLGAIWSSCSPDFGVQGVLDRFTQIEPKILFAADGYTYSCTNHDCIARLEEITSRLPSLRRVVVIPLLRNDPPTLSKTDLAISWDGAIAQFPPQKINFVQLPFNHPIYIMFTSGTTGKPKCLFHGAGGTLLKHVTEHAFHMDIKRDDRIYYYTSTGWAMWNWLATVLARGATMVTYDGSPFFPTPAVQFDLASAEQVTLFGTSARFIDSIRRIGLAPIKTHRLTNVRTIVSTGSPLVADNYEYVYKKIKETVFLSSFSGGTDILGGFVGGQPTSPIWAGEMQSAFLGMDVSVFNPDGTQSINTKGELVCKQSFPSMPLYFFDDKNREKYKQAYFSMFDNVWCQGDFAAATDHGGFIIYGRSDAVLKVGGIRIGTAEIYQQLEKVDEVLECVVVGQEWLGDVRVVLFVRLAEETVLDENLRERIRNQIRRNTTPRHVPDLIIQVDDIPRTMNGKIAESVVINTIHGRPVKNAGSLLNPEALHEFCLRPELLE